MPSQKQDLRVIRTHKMICNALIELLKSKEFEQIAVQDIVELAMVNRATFYKYYSGKSDLAGALISDFKQEYAQILKQRFETKDINELLKTATPFLFENRHLILALWKIKTKRHHLYDDMFLMLKNGYLQNAQTVYPKQDLDFQATLFAKMILESMRYHFENNLPIEPKKVAVEVGQILKIMAV